MDRLPLSLLAAVLLAAPAARADLYRWVDPATGSVKLSSYPPPAGRPSEVIPYSGQGAPVPPPSMLAGGVSASPLEQRWRALLQGIAALPAQTDLRTGGEGLKRQIEAYQSVAAELDRADPAGASRRREEQARVFERLRKGLQAQLGPASPMPQ